MDDLEIRYEDLTGMLHASQRVSPDYEVAEVVMSKNDIGVITVRFRHTPKQEN